MHDRILKYLALILLLFSPLAQAERPVIRLTDLDGGLHSSERYAGKWLIVNYWASWCPPCRREIPELAALHERHKGRDVVVLGVNYEDIEHDELRDITKRLSIPYPVINQPPSSKGPFGMIYALPTTFVISPTGDLVASKEGEVTREELERRIAYFKQLASQAGKL